MQADENYDNMKSIIIKAVYDPNFHELMSWTFMSLGLLDTLWPNEKSKKDFDQEEQPDYHADH